MIRQCPLTCDRGPSQALPWPTLTCAPPLPRSRLDPPKEACRLGLAVNPQPRPRAIPIPVAALLPRPSPALAPPRRALICPALVQLCLALALPCPRWSSATGRCRRRPETPPSLATVPPSTMEPSLCRRRPASGREEEEMKKEGGGKKMGRQRPSRPGQAIWPTSQSQRRAGLPSRSPSQPMKPWTELSRWVIEPARPTYEPSTAYASLFLFLLPGPDTRDPPVCESVLLTCGPPLGVDPV